MADLTIKRGATLQLVIAAANTDGTPYDLTTVQTTSQVRDCNGKFIADLALVVTGVPGQFSVAQPTADWPVGQLVMDFKIVQGLIVLKSQTVTIEVDKAVTTLASA